MLHELWLGREPTKHNNYELSYLGMIHIMLTMSLVYTPPIIPSTLMAE